MGRRNDQKTKLIKIITAFTLTCLVLWSGAQSTADAEMVSGDANQNSVEEVLSVEDPALTNDDAEAEQLIDGGVQENEGIDVGQNVLVETDESTSQESSDQSGNETAVGNQREDEPVEEEPVASATSPSTDLQLTRTQDVTLDAASSDIRYATGIFTGELQDATTALGVEMAIIDGVSHDVVDDASVLSKLAAIQQAIVYDEISNRVIFELKSGTIIRIDALDWAVKHVFDISVLPSSFVYENGSYDRDLIVLKLSSGTTINGGDESRVFTRSELLKLNERYGSITVSLDNDRLYFDANKKQTVTLDEVSLSLGTVREYSIDVKLKDGYVPQEPECKTQIACESKYGTELTYSRNAYGFIKVNNIDKQREAAAQRAKEMAINKDAQKAASTLNGMDVANSMQLTLDSYLNEFLTPAQKRELERYLIVYYTDVIESLRFAPDDFTSELQRKVMNKILGKLGVSINQYFFFGNTTAECKVEFESAKYGAVVVELKTVFSSISMDAHSNPYASFGKIDYKVLVDDKSLVKGKTTEGMGVASFASLETFGKQVRSVAYSSLKGAYGGIWKSDASKVASVFIDSTMGRYMAGEFASGVYKLVTKPVDYYVNSNALSTQAELEAMSDDAGEGTSVSSYKKIVLPQEVDIDVYDWDGELCGSLHDGKVTPGNGEAPIVIGSSYTNGSSSTSLNCVYLTVNDYVVNVSAKRDCRATLGVEEYENGELARSVKASDLQLLAGKQYYCLVLAGVGTGTEEYSLVSEDGDILECDSEYLPNDPDGFFSAPLYAEGSCGENVTYRFYAGSSLDPRSTLVISGNGPMKNYDQNNLQAPYVFSIAHNIVIEDGVTSVGTCSFGARNTTWAGSTYVENVALADSVKTIGDRAFWKSDLSYIHIGKGCEHVSSAAFCYTPNLYALEVDEENDYLKSVNGVLFTKDGSRLIRYHHRSEDSYTIPDDVLFIDEDAFGDCVDLSSVEIPDSVISMPGEVFDGCSGLESISIHAQEVDLGRGLGALSSSPTIYAYSGSDAQAYAEQKGLPFVSLGAAPSTIKKRAYAILYKNGNLVFQRGSEADSSEGAIETTFTGFEAHDKRPWEDVASKVKSVRFKEALSPLNVHKWFAGMSKCVSINLANLDTRWTDGTEEMFRDCSSLEQLDISMLNTDSVTSMAGMFKSCSSLNRLDLTNLNTSNVTDMSYMFGDCENLTDLNVSALITSKVSDAEGMFRNCSSLKLLDVTNFDTRNFYNMEEMFAGCSSLKQLDVTCFDTSHVLNMERLFSGCSSLEAIDLHGFDTSGVDSIYSGASIEGMFNGCSSLRTLDLSSFDTSKIKDFSYMFNGCSSLRTLDLSSFDTSIVEDLSSMFEDCSSLVSLVVSNWDTSFVGNTRSMFRGCSSLPSLDVSGWNTERVRDAYDMFSCCDSLAVLTVGDEFFRATDFYLPDGLWIRDADGAEFTSDAFPSGEGGVYRRDTGLSLQYIPIVEKRSMVRGVDYGYTLDADGNASNCWYKPPLLQEGDILQITRNGITSKYVYTDLIKKGEDKPVEQYCFVNANDDTERLYDGYYNNYDIDFDYISGKIEFVYEDVRVRIPIVFLDSIQLSFKAVANDVVMTKGEDYDYELDKDGELSYCWHDDPLKPGDTLYVSRGDTTNTYVYDVWEDDEDGEPVVFAGFVNTDDESDVLFEGDYEIGFDYIGQLVTLTYLGETVEIPITFGEASGGESDVTLRVETGELVMTRGINYDYELDDDGDVTNSWYDSAPFSEGDKLFVTKDGETKEYEYREWEDDSDWVRGFVNVDDGNDVIATDDYYVDYDFVEKTATLHYLDAMLDLDVRFVEKQEMSGDYEDTVTSGTWGTCPWELRGDGTLLIMPGEGAEPAEDELGSPWEELAKTYQILAVKAVGQDGKKAVAPTNSSGLFTELEDVTTIRLSDMDVSRVTNMSGMFSDCYALESIVLTGWDTSQVTDMQNMFYNCGSLTAVNVLDFNTSKVTNMRCMFTMCSNLRSVDPSAWDVGNVEMMDYLFYGCSSLGELDLSGWDTSSAWNMASMFEGCHSLSRLNIQNWNTSAVKYMTAMFSGCSSLGSLDLASFDTSAISRDDALSGQAEGALMTQGIWWEGMNSMYDGCTSLSSWKIGAKYDTSIEGAVPDATAINGKWWSSATNAWYTPKQIAKDRPLKADVYLNESTALVDISSATVTVPGQTYSGTALAPAPTVLLGGATLLAGTDYDVTYRDNVNAGTATVTVTGKGDYAGAATATFRISPADLAKASVSGIANRTYDGKAQTQNPTVRLGATTLKAGTDYTVSYKNNMNAGTATVTIAGRGNYAGAKSATFAISKVANGMTVKAKKVTLKAKGLKKKAQSVKASKLATVKGAQGKVSYKLKSVTNKKFTEYFKVASSGKLTVKKGLKKGTYRLKVAVTAAGDANHEKVSKTITCKVVVK